MQPLSLQRCWGMILANNTKLSGHNKGDNELPDYSIPLDWADELKRLVKQLPDLIRVLVLYCMANAPSLNTETASQTSDYTVTVKVYAMWHRHQSYHWSVQLRIHSCNLLQLRNPVLYNMCSANKKIKTKTPYWNDEHKQILFLSFRELYCPKGFKIQFPTVCLKLVATLIIVKLNFSCLRHTKLTLKSTESWRTSILSLFIQLL